MNYINIDHDTRFVLIIGFSCPIQSISGDILLFSNFYKFYDLFPAASLEFLQNILLIPIWKPRCLMHPIFPFVGAHGPP